jgi:hypothetical protein
MAVKLNRPSIPQPAGVAVSFVHGTAHIALGKWPVSKRGEINPRGPPRLHPDFTPHIETALAIGQMQGTIRDRGQRWQWSLMLPTYDVMACYRDDWIILYSDVDQVTAQQLADSLTQRIGPSKVRLV